MKTTYIGSSYKVAEDIFINDFFELEAIICEKTAVNYELLLFSEVNDVPIHLVNDRKNLEKIFLMLTSQVFIMYGFGIIIPQNITKKNKIFNLHTGSLQSHRGRHPIERAILQNDKIAEINLYKINHKIDLGECIAKGVVTINLLDNNLDIHKKLLDKVPTILEELKNYLNGKVKAIMIDNGIYEPRVMPSDYTINLNDDTIADIYNKIRAQAKYKGAILVIDKQQYHIGAIANMSLLSEDEITKEAKILNINENKIICIKDEYKLELIFFKD